MSERGRGQTVFSTSTFTEHGSYQPQRGIGGRAGSPIPQVPLMCISALGVGRFLAFRRHPGASAKTDMAMLVSAVTGVALPRRDFFLSPVSELQGEAPHTYPSRLRCAESEPRKKTRIAPSTVPCSGTKPGGTEYDSSEKCATFSRTEGVLVAPHRRRDCRCRWAKALGSR